MMRKETEEDQGFEDSGDPAADSTATYDDYLKMKAENEADAEDDADAKEDDADEQGDDDSANDGDESADSDDSDDGDSSDDDKDSDSDEASSEDDSADGDDDKQDDKDDSDADAKADDEEKSEVNLKAERAEARAEHAQQAHDALTGKYGKLVQDFKGLEERLNARDKAQREQRGDDDGYQREFNEAESKEIADLRRKVEELQDSKRADPTLTAEQVLLQEAHGFAQSSRYRVDAARYEEPIKAALGEALAPGARLTVALDNGDMDAARFIARDVMREAYYDAKDKEQAEVSANNLKRKEKTSKDLRRKKRDAAPAGVGTRGKSARDSEIDIDPDALTKNPALARDPAFLKRLAAAGKKLGR